MNDNDNGGALAITNHNNMIYKCKHKHNSHLEHLQDVLEAQLESTSHDSWTILSVMPRMYFNMRFFDLQAATWPCLQDMPITAILPTESSLA